MSAEDTKGDTPLHLAAWAGNVEALASLLSHGADVDWLSGRDGYSPLWCAISANHIDAARLLLSKYGARVSLRSGSGLMPLHQAAVTGQSAMCELLLDRGAQVDARDDDQNTALHYAAASGSKSSVRILLQAGAAVTARQAQGLTALHWAAHKGHVDALSLLLDHMAPLNAGAEEGATPLHLAANRGHLAAVRILLERGCKRKVFAVWDGVEGTAAEMARAKNHARVARAIQSFESTS
jgi:ankyrin repeat protein